MSMTTAQVLEKLLSGVHLSEQEAFDAMRGMLTGETPPAQIAALLTVLRAKGETDKEIAGFVRAMRGAMVKVKANARTVVDTCGTGGDGRSTFNISTAAAFVAAGSGAVVAKHGNRSISSRCGSADVLEAAGVKVDMSHQVAERCLNEVGITFLFAPLYHPAMKNVAPIRKELGIRTVFNILGPLCNPAGANAQVVGVPNRELTLLIANILKRLAKDAPATAMVVHEAGYDEIVLQSSAMVLEVSAESIVTKSIAPKDFGMKKIALKALAGGDAAQNAAILRQVLSNELPVLADVVAANAALALLCVDRNAPPVGKPLTLEEAAARARESIASGAALKKLNALAEMSKT